MASDSSKKSDNSGARDPRTVVLSPCLGNVGSNGAGKVFVTATNSDISLASGLFIKAREKAKDR